MSILKQLLDNNELYCYYDFRSGTYLDYTGNTTLTGTADTSLVKGKLIIPSTKRMTIGSVALGTGDFSIVSKTRQEVYSKHILGATNFNLTVYGEFDLSTFFGGATYYNSANQSKVDILRWNKIGATYDRDGNATYYENGLSFRTIDISATSAQSKTDTYYLGNTNSGYIEYEYFLLAKRVLSATEMAQLTAELENKKWTSKAKSRASGINILPDGDMKSLKINEWVTSGSTLLKIDDVKRWLRITGTANNGQAYQRILVSGKTYRVTGYCRGNGTASPRVYLGAGKYFFIGTTSTDWQYIDITFTATDNYFSLMAYGASGEYADFAEIKVCEVGSDEVIYKTENGIKADQKSSVAGNKLSNSDFIASDTTFKVSDDTFNSEDVKVIEYTHSVSGDYVYIPTSVLKQTPTESAYGEWKFWFKKTASNCTLRAGIISSEAVVPNSGTNNGYYIYVGASALLNFVKVVSGTPTTILTGSPITDTEYHEIKLTRSITGVFELFVDNVSQGTTTDNTHTTNNYMVLNPEGASSKIILSSERGTYGIIKK